MKPASFNVFIPLDDDETIIYNTFSDSRVIVNSELVKAVDLLIERMTTEERNVVFGLLKRKLEANESDIHDLLESDKK